MKKIVKKIEVRKAHVERSFWWWRMIAWNGKIISSSEMYTTEGKCLQTARKVSKQLGVMLKLYE